MSTKHLLALLNSHIEGDEEQFLSIALQVAAQEARQGRSEDADKLKRLVQKARDQQRSGRPSSGQTPIPLARPRGELQGLVESAYPKITLASMVLSDAVRNRLIRSFASSRNAPRYATTDRRRRRTCYLLAHRARARR
jgi:hypothetical protein